jgi:hypothetical protein
VAAGAEDVEEVDGGEVACVGHRVVWAAGGHPATARLRARLLKLD